MSDKLPLIAFAASLTVLGSVYGVVAARNGWFPNPQINQAFDTVRDVQENWKNDVGLEPTRHLVPSRTPGEEAFTMTRPDRVTPGYTLIAGLSTDQDAAPFAVTMYDDQGRQVYQWPIDYADADPDGKSPLNVMLHGMQPMPDGSLVMTFDAGNAVARYDSCGAPTWSTLGEYHHIVTPDGPGSALTWRANTIARIDLATGASTDLLGIEEDMIPAGDGQEGIFGVRTFINGGDNPLSYDSDPFHTNDVEVLSEDMAAAFPDFAAGDLLVSLRELNMIAVVDRTTAKVKWYSHGPWLKQHDPDFQPDGTISVYDNHTGAGQTSRIVSIDPKTNSTKVLFKGSDEVPFYSWQRGKHQILPSGNILITEAQRGRVFEVTAAGDPVWNREMRWDATQNVIVTEARWVPADFFDGGVPRCDVTAGMNAPAAPRG